MRFAPCTSIIVAIFGKGSGYKEVERNAWDSGGQNLIVQVTSITYRANNCRTVTRKVDLLQWLRTSYYRIEVTLFLKFLIFQWINGQF